MRIFISYAREQLPIAERLTYALRHEEHTVFFAETELRGGESFGSAIRREIHACDLFVFLISPESVSARYPLSELDVIQKVEPVPRRRVLPVMAVPVPIDSVPNYLRPLSILSPKGDLVAEVVNRIAEISAERRWRRLLLAAALLAFVVVAGILIWRGIISRGIRSSPSEAIPLVRPAGAITIGFQNLTGGDQSAFTSYTESGFTVKAVSGSWLGAGSMAIRVPTFIS